MAVSADAPDSESAELLRGFRPNITSEAQRHGYLTERMVSDVRLLRTKPERTPTETATDIPKRSNNAKIIQKNHWEANANRRYIPLVQKNMSAKPASWSQVLDRRSMFPTLLAAPRPSSSSKIPIRKAKDSKDVRSDMVSNDATWIGSIKPANRPIWCQDN